jgi:hypothetical protein
MFFQLDITMTQPWVITHIKMAMIERLERFHMFDRIGTTGRLQRLALQ